MELAREEPVPLVDMLLKVMLAIVWPNMTQCEGEAAEAETELRRRVSAGEGAVYCESTVGSLRLQNVVDGFV